MFTKNQKHLLGSQMTRSFLDTLRFLGIYFLERDSNPPIFKIDYIILPTLLKTYCFAKTEYVSIDKNIYCDNFK